jgi:chromatin segregation and condensation protein Rec8/ScpA/Scc1 (kleisin family)
LSLIPAQERACRVVLQDVFDGPLDLLLHLVKEQQLDIATVPLATVADQYFGYITAMEQLDVELATEYLVIAATLVFLKSRSLLPPIPPEFVTEGEETPEMLEERLRQRLITYSKYREAGDELRRFLSDAGAHYYREGGDPTSELRQRYRIVPDKLATALIAALRSAKEEKRPIVRDRFTFLAILELIRRGRVGYDQPHSFADIRLFAVAPAPAGAAS